MTSAANLVGELLATPAGEWETRLHHILAEDQITPSALATAAKGQYDLLYASDPARASAIADILNLLVILVDNALVRGYAAWVSGLASMDAGQFADATRRLTHAEHEFAEANQTALIATVQTGKMAALAVQGLIEHALKTGLAARSSALVTGDLLAIGKIEQNLGNLSFVSHHYVEAENYYRQALARFVEAKDERQLAQIENCLATTLTSQHRFVEAEALYVEALRRADAEQLDVTLAEIECNVGCLALYQGRYERALEYLERSRRRYAHLDMPHEVAIADQELADAYLELNLAAEAAALYTQVVPVFESLGMPIERARALAYHGRARSMLRETTRAHELLAEAQQLYAAAALPLGEAITQLARAELHMQSGDLDVAESLLREVEPRFALAHAEGWRLQARWLLGSTLRRQGRLAEAGTILAAAMAQAQETLVTQMIQRCATELGLVALAGGDVAAAEVHFHHAIDLVESMRSPLPAEEFRMSFMGDKLTPYYELVRICLADGTPQRLAEALNLVERSRSRALLDELGNNKNLLSPRDSDERQLLEKLQQLRDELNWFYSQLNRPDRIAGDRGYLSVDALHAAARDHERAILTVARQLQQGMQATAQHFRFDLAAMQRELGSESALVEYIQLDGDLWVFVVTDSTMDAFPLHCTEAEIETLLEQIRFQVGALRNSAHLMLRHMPALVQRMQRPLTQLHALLLGPVIPSIGSRRLVIAPSKSLHYVPFHALFDGTQYVVEAREVVVTPSATLLHHCLARTVAPVRSALLLGKADEYAPRVADEVATVAPLFDDAIVLIDGDATRAGLVRHAPHVDLVHIACHGHFRSDNPFFSALHLADGWMVVRDAYDLRLNCALVTLSACETGLSAVAPGEDLVGLARGFLLAGAPSLLVSLWVVNDAATADLMATFYRELLAGARPAAALRHAQLEQMRQRAHPFFWAPFCLIGRW